MVRKTDGDTSLTLFCGVCQPLAWLCLTVKFIFRPLVSGKCRVDHEGCRGLTYRFSKFPQGHSREFRLHTCCREH